MFYSIHLARSMRVQLHYTSNTGFVSRTLPKKFSFLITQSALYRAF
jgi:hypothetical protein